MQQGHTVRRNSGTFLQLANGVIQPCADTLDPQALTQQRELAGVARFDAKPRRGKRLKCTAHVHATNVENTLQMRVGIDLPILETPVMHLPDPQFATLLLAPLQAPFRRCPCPPFAAIFIHLNETGMHRDRAHRTLLRLELREHIQYPACRERAFALLRRQLQLAAHQRQTTQRLILRDQTYQHVDQLFRADIATVHHHRNPAILVDWHTLMAAQHVDLTAARLVSQQAPRHRTVFTMQIARSRLNPLIIADLQCHLLLIAGSRFLFLEQCLQIARGL